MGDNIETILQRMLRLIRTDGKRLDKLEKENKDLKRRVGELEFRQVVK